MNKADVFVESYEFAISSAKLLTRKSRYLLFAFVWGRMEQHVKNLPLFPIGSVRRFRDAAMNMTLSEFRELSDIAELYALDQNDQEIEAFWAVVSYYFVYLITGDFAYVAYIIDRYISFLEEVSLDRPEIFVSAELSNFQEALLKLQNNCGVEDNLTTHDMFTLSNSQKLGALISWPN